MLGRAACPRSSTASPGTIISAANDISATASAPARKKRLSTSVARRPSARTDSAASTSGRSASAPRKPTASKRLDLPAPLTPATQVKGPKWRSRSRRFLKPETLRRVSMPALRRSREVEGDDEMGADGHGLAVEESGAIGPAAQRLGGGIGKREGARAEDQIALPRRGREDVAQADDRERQSCQPPTPPATLAVHGFPLMALMVLVAITRTIAAF